MTVPADIESHCRMFALAFGWVKNSRGTAARLEALANVEGSVTSLLPYADKGMATLDPHPREILSEIEGMRRGIIEDEVQDRLAEARRRAQDATTDAGKLGGYGKAIEGLMRYINGLPDVTALEAGVLVLRAERDALKASLLCQNADVAIAKGRKNQARDYLVDALMALRHDATPDHEQVSKIKELEHRIAALDAS
jgi:hypothetical protein